MDKRLKILENVWVRWAAFAGVMLATANLFFPMEWGASKLKDFANAILDVETGRLVAFIGAFAVFLYGQIKHDIRQKINNAAAAAAAAAAPAAAPAMPEPTPHDVKLAKNFFSIFGPTEARFLKLQEFGTPIYASSLSFFDDLNQWTGVHYKFDDVTLEERFSKLLRVTCEVGHKISSYVGPLHNSNNFEILTIKNEQDAKTGRLSLGTLARIQELGKEANELLEQYDAFFLIIRAQMPKVFSDLEGAV